MKVVYCCRMASSPIHIHAGSYAEMYYVPELNLAIGIESIGFGSKKVFLSETDYILEEGKKLIEGKIPEKDGCSFEKIKIEDYENEKLKTFLDIIEKIRIIKSNTRIVEDWFENVD